MEKKPGTFHPNWLNAPVWDTLCSIISVSILLGFSTPANRVRVKHRMHLSPHCLEISFKHACITDKHNVKQYSLNEKNKGYCLYCAFMKITTGWCECIKKAIQCSAVFLIDAISMKLHEFSRSNYKENQARCSVSVTHPTVGFTSIQKTIHCSQG